MACPRSRGHHGSDLAADLQFDEFDRSNTARFVVIPGFAGRPDKRREAGINQCQSAGSTARVNDGRFWAPLSRGQPDGDRDREGKVVMKTA